MNVLEGYTYIYIKSDQLLSHVQLFATPWIAASQASLSITNSRSLLKLMSIVRSCHPNISSSVVPFSFCLQSFPASGSFPRSLLFTSGGLSLLQGIFAIQGSNSGLPHCRPILYQLSHRKARQILYLLSYEGSPHIYICVCLCLCAHACAC